MPAIFISFVHEDSRVADATKRLIEHELKLKKGVFLSSDKGQVFAGDSWVRKITDALADSSLVILMLSARSVQRPWVNFEAGGGWLTGKKIIPCCYGKQKKDRLPHPYAALQALNLKDEPHYLLESIHHHLGLASPPPLSPSAISINDHFAEDERKRRGDPVDIMARDPLEAYLSLQSALRDFKDEA